MKRFNDLISECLPHITEVFPWDIDDELKSGETPLILDIREPDEFSVMHIQDSLHVPRGVLESACEYDYEETNKELVEARDQRVVIVCRSGNRSALAAYTLQLMGYRDVCSMKTGLRGWNDYDQPLFDVDGNVVNADEAEEFFTSHVRPEQLKPKG